jgi:hypothetical protein
MTQKYIDLLLKVVLLLQVTISSSNDIPKLAVFGGPAARDLIMFVLDK